MTNNEIRMTNQIRKRKSEGGIFLELRLEQPQVFIMTNLARSVSILKLLLDIPFCLERFGEPLLMDGLTACDPRCVQPDGKETTKHAAQLGTQKMPDH